MPADRPIRTDMHLGDGRPATVLAMSLDTLGVSAGDRACVVHHDWMTGPQLRELSRCAADLADTVEAHHAG